MCESKKGPLFILLNTQHREWESQGLLKLIIEGKFGKLHRYMYFKLYRFEFKYKEAAVKL